MSCNKPQTIAHKPSRTSSSDESATLWEHIVLHRVSEEQVMLFDVEIEDKEANAKNNHTNRKMSALDAATTVMMDERQRCAFAPAKINTPTTKTTNTATAADGVPTELNPTPETGTETKLRAALFASLEPTAQTSPSSSSNSPNYTPPSSSPGHITFGPKQLSTLSPEIQEDEAKRQETLVKTRPTASLTSHSLTLPPKRRLSFRDDRSGAIVRDEELVMSGALDWADVRCEVCAARERAMGGLVEGGIVAF